MNCSEPWLCEQPLPSSSGHPASLQIAPSGQAGQAGLRWCRPAARRLGCRRRPLALRRRRCHRHTVCCLVDSCSRQSRGQVPQAKACTGTAKGISKPGVASPEGGPEGHIVPLCQHHGSWRAGQRPQTAREDGAALHVANRRRQAMYPELCRAAPANFNPENHETATACAALVRESARGCPSRPTGLTSVASTESCAPCQSGRPLQVTSMRQASCTGTSIFMSASRKFLATPAPASRHSSTVLPPRTGVRVSGQGDASGRRKFAAAALGHGIRGTLCPSSANPLATSGADVRQHS